MEGIGNVNKRVVNYIKLFLIVIISVIFMLLVCNIYKNINNNKSNKSYIDKYVNMGNYNDLSSILTEISNNQFIYLSYVGDKNIYNYEKDLVKSLKKNDLLDLFIYIDVTDVLLDDNTVDDLGDKLRIITDGDIVLPAIIYFKDGKPKDFIDSSDEIISVGKTEQLLEKWEVIND